MKDLINKENLTVFEKRYYEIKENWPKQGMDLSLDRIKGYLNYKGNPQNKLKVIQIGGTNGKGSTGTFIKSILENNGLKVGFFSSPSIIADNESIKINDKFIEYKIFSKDLLDICKNWEENFDEDNFLSFFEASTIVAIEYFLKEDVDIAIFEVGLGGRLDSTNVFSHKLIDVFSHIGLDHIGVLGNSIEEIATEKSGIIKNNDIVLSYPIPTEAVEVIKKKCIEKNAKFKTINIEDIGTKEIDIRGSTYTYKDFKDIFISMNGENQIYNSIMALEASLILQDKYGYKITEKNIREGLAKAFLPGRLEWYKYGNKDILFDGAHNEDGIDGFLSYVTKNIPKKFNLVIGILKDKEYEKIFYKLKDLNCRFYLTEVPFIGRQLTVEDANKVLKKYRNDKIYKFEDPIEAIKHAIDNSYEEEPVVVTGSLYLISKIREYLQNNI
ncbi:MAG: folylpolyglutamate synthase/dihydrofolate synthase family protein [Lagierella massiliensis]|nr:folylpolyglutamate synthase/dihydrofolate synthase family protein [Lagierella massiliensis]